MMQGVLWGFSTFWDFWPTLPLQAFAARLGLLEQFPTAVHQQSRLGQVRRRRLPLELVILLPHTSCLLLWSRHWTWWPLRPARELEELAACSLPRTLTPATPPSVRTLDTHLSLPYGQQTYGLAGGTGVYVVEETNKTNKLNDLVTAGTLIITAAAFLPLAPCFLRVSPRSVHSLSWCQGVSSHPLVPASSFRRNSLLPQLQSTPNSLLPKSSFPSSSSFSSLRASKYHQ